MTNNPELDDTQEITPYIVPQPRRLTAPTPQIVVEDDYAPETVMLRCTVLLKPDGSVTLISGRQVGEPVDSASLRTVQIEVRRNRGRAK